MADPISSSPFPYIDYDVQPNEGLDELTARFGVRQEDLIEANKDTQPHLAENPKSLREDINLKIPSGEHGGVEPKPVDWAPGQTLKELAAQYNVSPRLLLLANRNELKNNPNSPPKDGKIWLPVQKRAPATAEPAQPESNVPAEQEPVALTSEAPGSQAEPQSEETTAGGDSPKTPTEATVSEPPIQNDAGKPQGKPATLNLTVPIELGAPATPPASTTPDKPVTPPADPAVPPPRTVTGSVALAGQGTTEGMSGSLRLGVTWKPTPTSVVNGSLVTLPNKPLGLGVLTVTNRVTADVGGQVAASSGGRFTSNVNVGAQYWNRVNLRDGVASKPGAPPPSAGDNLSILLALGDFSSKLQIGGGVYAHAKTGFWASAVPQMEAERISPQVGGGLGFKKGPVEVTAGVTAAKEFGAGAKAPPDSGIYATASVIGKFTASPHLDVNLQFHITPIGTATAAPNDFARGLHMEPKVFIGVTGNY